MLRGLAVVVVALVAALILAGPARGQGGTTVYVPMLFDAPADTPITETPTPIPTASPPNSPTETASETATKSASPTATSTITRTATITDAATPTPTMSATATLTPLPTFCPFCTITPTPSPTPFCVAPQVIQVFLSYGNYPYSYIVQQDQQIDPGQTLTAWVVVTGGNRLFDFAWGLAPNVTPTSTPTHGGLRTASVYGQGMWTQSSNVRSNFIMQVTNPGDGTGGPNTESVQVTWQVCYGQWPAGIPSPTP